MNMKQQFTLYRPKHGENKCNVSSPIAFVYLEHSQTNSKEYYVNWTSHYYQEIELFKLFKIGVEMVNNGDSESHYFILSFQKTDAADLQNPRKLISSLRCSDIHQKLQ